MDTTPDTPAMSDAPEVTPIRAPKRIAISGSRDYPHLAWVDAVVRMIGKAGDTLLVGYDPVTKTPRGVDREVWLAAEALGVPCRPYRAEWLVGGRKNMDAGIKRNIAMINDADHVVAFWDCRSRGTAHAIVYAHQTGKLFRIYPTEWDTNDAEVLLRRAYAVRGVPFLQPTPVPAPLADG